MLPTAKPSLLQARGLIAVRAAMFDNLNRGLEKAWDLVRKDGKLTKDNIKGPMREIRRALLEADVRQLSHKPWQKRPSDLPVKRACSEPTRHSAGCLGSCRLLGVHGCKREVNSRGQHVHLSIICHMGFEPAQHVSPRA